jgi:hypothetical protein
VVCFYGGRDPINRLVGHMPDLAFAFLVIFALGFAIGYGVRENMSRKRHRRFAERGPKKWDQQLVEEAKPKANEAAEQQRLATAKAEQEREAEAKREANEAAEQQRLATVKAEQERVAEAKPKANEAAEQQRLASVKADQEREAEAKSAIAALTSQQQPAVGKVLGLDLANLTDELRKKHNIEDRVKGVLITGVDPNSQASQKRLTPGMVITGVQLYEVPNVTELQQRIDTVKKDGKKTAMLRVTTPDGNQPRFVGFSLE